MSQTTINAGGQAFGVAGQVSDAHEGRSIVSGFNTDTNQLPFGIALKQDSANEKGVMLPSSLTDTLVGMNVFGGNHVPAVTLANGQITGDLGPTGLLQYASCQVGRRGRYFALLDGSVTSIVPGIDRCYVRAVATGSYQAGAWGATANASYMIDLSKVGIFTSGVKTAADGTSKIAEVELDFTSKP